MIDRLSITSALLMLACGIGCDSKRVDGSDLHGVFDPPARSATSASASAQPKATGRASASASTSARPPMVHPRERKPLAGPCIAANGTPAEADRRAAGRPACRRARMLEHRDGSGAPRYGCVFTARHYEKHTPLPLLVFLHGEADSPTAVHKKTRLRVRYGKLDLTGDPKHVGFVVLAPQARNFKRRRSWDVSYTGPDNVDVAAIDRFVDQLISEGAVDRRQIYAIGESRGGVMAALYAMLRPDRIAAYGVYAADASRLKWSCDGEQPPAAVLYRACDAVAPCADIERWLSLRHEQRAPTFSMRLGAGKATEPSCALAKSRCRPKKGATNHARWPKPREREMLEYLGRYSLDRSP